MRARLLAQLRSYGPNALLWVETADAEHAPGSVGWQGEGLLKAYIDRFAPGEDAHDLSLDCWIAICREAYRLYRTETGAVRTFCDVCGTSLTYEISNRPGEIDITTGSLDHPEDFQPTKDVFPDEKLPWVRLVDEKH